MKTSDFDYDLPEEQIAQHPSEKRDESKLLIVDRQSGELTDTRFNKIIDELTDKDLLVINDTRVLPARIFGKRAHTGANIEFLLHKDLGEDRWEVLSRPAKRVKVGDTIVFDEGLTATVLKEKEQGLREVEFSYDGIFEEVLERIGTMPLPPYIHEKLEDQSRYQTVYAENPGSAAAPTAGLHFTKELLGKIRDKGVEIVPVTLNVGLGTFRPVDAEEVTDHKMHSESFYISRDSAERINEAIKEGKRIVAVGTTSVRALESAFDGEVKSGRFDTDIFIYPGYEFKVVDALITNFHLPKSTLLMLVSAFYDRQAILEAYRHAVENDYRFFSFGDAMFLK